MRLGLFGGLHGFGASIFLRNQQQEHHERRENSFSMDISETEMVC